MSEDLARRFERDRTHLRSVAYRMLGSASDAEDAVQEAWLRLSRSDTSAVENLTGWLTTVVARVCLDMLRSRKSRREEPDIGGSRPVAEQAASIEQEKVLADRVGLAVLVVLDTLEPAERLAFVLHDLFGVSFGEIAEIVGRTPAAARQLASRARRRVQGAEVDEAELSRQRPVVEAFMTALKTADFDALMQVLDPDVLVRGPGGEVRGAKAWAKGAMQFAQSVAMPKVAESVRLAIVNGNVGIVFAPHGNVVRVIELVVEDGLIRELEVIMEPARVQACEVTIPGS